MNSESLTVVRVITPPCRVDGGVCRVVELSDGGGRVESWIKGRGWVPGGATLKEVAMGSPTADPEGGAR
jgi:hypothetical protein